MNEIGMNEAGRCDGPLLSGGIRDRDGLLSSGIERIPGSPDPDPEEPEAGNRVEFAGPDRTLAIPVPVNPPP